MPLLILQSDLYARPLSFRNATSECNHQGLDMGKDDSRRRRMGKDGLKRLAVFGVHEWRC